jgi:hypothetical protein
LKRKDVLMPMDDVNKAANWCETRDWKGGLESLKLKTRRELVKFDAAQKAKRWGRCSASLELAKAFGPATGEHMQWSISREPAIPADRRIRPPNHRREMNAGAAFFSPPSYCFPICARTRGPLQAKPGNAAGTISPGWNGGKVEPQYTQHLTGQQIP